jgi:hypothetical protein
MTSENGNDPVADAAYATVAGRIGEHGTKAEGPDPLELFYAKAEERTQGEDVAVDAEGEGGPRLFIRVFPVRYEHMEGFIDEVEGLVRKTLQAATGAGGFITPESFLGAMPSIIPSIAGGASGMVAEACVAWVLPEDVALAVAKTEEPKRRAALNRAYQMEASRAGTPNLKRLPFHVQCACVEAWLRQSFMGDKLRPLAGMVETLLRVTGTKQLKIADLWRRFSSGKDTTPPQSPAPGDATGAAGGLTPGGASPNSGGGRVPRSAFTEQSLRGNG